MKLIGELLPGVLEFELVTFRDDRGAFTETFNRRLMASFGVDAEFVQDNQSLSRSASTIRGLHLQLPPHAQGKLVRVLRGAIYDVAVDVRPDSPTYREHCAVRLDEQNGRVLWVPPGYAHGFCTLTPETEVLYKVTSLYEKAAERSIRWDDPSLAIPWPVDAGGVILSDKDRVAPLLTEIEEEL